MKTQRKFWTHTTMADESVVSTEVPVNLNPEAILGTVEPWEASRRVGFTAHDVGVVIDALVGHHPDAIAEFEALPVAVVVSAIRFAFRLDLIRQEGQRVTLTRYGVRYLRNYDR